MSYKHHPRPCPAAPPGLECCNPDCKGERSIGCQCCHGVPAERYTPPLIPAGPTSYFASGSCTPYPLTDEQRVDHARARILPPKQGGHDYRRRDDAPRFNSVFCLNCPAWMGSSRSGGPDPFGLCPSQRGGVAE